MPKFVPRDRKQRKKPKTHNDSTDPATAPSQDPNALIVLPNTIEEKVEKVKRREELKEELRNANSKVSSKKQKRLNKYIDNKLKKEERVELIRKLAGEQVDTTLFQSSTQLGVTKETKKNQIKRALLEEKAGINSEHVAQILYEERDVLEVATIEDHDESMSDGSEEVVREEQSTTKPSDDTRAQELAKFKSLVGSGLKRPLETNDDGMPIIKRVKKSGKPIRQLFQATNSESDGDEYESWGGFDDSSEEIKAGVTKVDKAVQSEDEDEGSTIGDESVSEDDDEGPDEESENESDAESTSQSSIATDDNDEDMDAKTRLRRRGGNSSKASAFKSWALSQRNELDGTEQHPNLLELHSVKKLDEAGPPAPDVSTRDLSQSPVPEEPTIDRKVFYVNVTRSELIQQQRIDLPVVAEEQRIMEAIHRHDVVVICGETGSGKTTQVPQFLFEAGYGSPASDTPGMIGVTQPRRVAAVSMSKRVGEELGDHQEKVAYQIRFEGSVKDDTAVKFMTDGVLLREVSEDFLLKKYSAVIIDEAHERSINTDILIGVMSRIVKLRGNLHKEDQSVKPLKLIIMSATLRVSDFTENTRLFPIPPPILQAEARQFKVTNRFSLRTRHDYVEEAYKKICRIHKRLPQGGILVFLTGQVEINTLSRRLRQTFAKKASKKNVPEAEETSVQILSKDAIVESEDVELSLRDDIEIREDMEDEDEELEEDMGEEEADEDTTDELVILPLYSLLPTKEQMKVFEPLKPNQRLCVLATNVAETSLTIPGIKYVVDTGRVKERTYDKTTGVQSFDVRWISKASASQRSGRAGRTGPGQCYRLYSSAVFERDFDEYVESEILRMPIEGVVLQMKSMNIHTIVNFPFPTPPDREGLHKAEKLLGYLGALDDEGKLTEAGRNMNIFPLSPRFSKTLIIGQQFECLPYVIALVSALSVGELFIPEHQLGFDVEDDDDDVDVTLDNQQKMAEEVRSRRRKAYNEAQRGFAMLDVTSDVLKLLTAVCAFEHETNQGFFCESKFVRYKGMQETRKMRQQLTNIVRANFPDTIGSFEPKLAPPSHIQIRALKQIIATGFIDQVAIRGDLLPNSDIKKNYRKMADVPYFTLLPSSSPPVGNSNDPNNILASAVYIHPSSVLTNIHQNRKDYPEYIVYSELQRSSGESGRIRMKPLSTLTGQQLSNLAKGSPLLTYSKPLHHPAPVVTSELGSGGGGTRRECWVVPRFGAAMGKSEMGWTLPPRKVVQIKAAGSTKWHTDW